MPDNTERQQQGSEVDIVVAEPSFPQQVLWTLEQMQEGAPTYNIQIRLRFLGALDERALRRAIDEVVARHEVLRTNLQFDDGELVQVIKPPQGVPCQRVDLSDKPESMGELTRFAADRLVETFDSAVDLPVRAALAKLGDDDHALVITLDHLVCDAWSLQVLHDELCSLYLAFRDGKPSPLAELPIQYADYAAWQRDRLQGDVLAEQVGYWRDRLAGDIPRVELPTVSRRGRERAGASVRQPLDSDLVSALADVGKQTGASLFTLLLAAFKMQLCRYSRQPDITVGTMLAGRTLPELEPLIGFFVNTVALRTDLSGDLSWREVLGRVRDTVFDAMEHQDVPFDQVVTAIRPERAAGEQPFFTVLFQFADIERKVVTAPGVRIEPMRMESEPAPEDLVVAILREDGEYVCVWDYDATLFDLATVERMQSHFLAMLRSLAGGADLRPGDVDLLDTPERAAISAYAGSSGTAAWLDLAVHQGTALSWPDGEMSYAELAARVDRLASWLSANEIGPENLVGLVLQHGWQHVVAMLAVWRAGAAFLPLDPRSGGERVEVVLHDAQPDLVIVSGALADRVPDGLRCAAYEEISDGTDGATTLPEALSENMAYVVYTSGSTGKPKGAVLTRRGLSTIIPAQDKAIGLGAEDCLLQSASTSFDAYIHNVVMAFATGARLHIPGEQFAADISGTIRDNGVTVVNLPPSALAILQPDDDLGSLRLVLVAGEACPPGLAAAWAARYQLVNLYGPTEATIWSTAYGVRASDQDLATLPIGAPIPGVRAHVLDQDLRPMPIGLPGELHLGGDVVARGYKGLPGRTAGSFVPDPFDELPGSRLYRTGDQARWRADGMLEFLGRSDHQVKVRGHRIELGEIESVLARDPAVREAVVILDGTGAEARLLAYVIPRQDTSEGHLRQLCADVLPDYMVPASIVLVTELPRTATGKVDRKVLPRPDTVTAAPPPIRQTTRLVQAITDVWSEILGHTPEPGADFFRTGGHSLAAARVVTRLRRDLGVNVPVRMLFDHPTLAAFSEAVHEVAVTIGSDLVAPSIEEHPEDSARITRQQGGRPVPLSFGQERMWLVEQTGGATPFSNMAFAIRLRGPLHVDALERAITEIHHRHEVLRTVFDDSAGEVRQVVKDLVPVSLEIVDCVDLTEADRLAREFTSAVYRLDAEPPIRWRMCRIGAEDHLLVLGVHHIAGDGWSEAVLNRELSHLYGAFVAGTQAELPPLTIQYGDYATWQRDRAGSGELAEQMDFWRDQLRDSPPALALPFDTVPDGNTGWQGESAFSALPAGLTRELDACAAAHGVTPFIVAFSAFAVLLHRYSGQDDLIVGIPVAGRVRPELEQLIGFFINTVALRADLSGDPRFVELLERVRESTLDVFANQEVPFDLVVEESQVDGQEGRRPLVQVLFQLHNTPAEPLTLSGLHVDQQQLFGRTAVLDLTVSLVPDVEGMHGLWEFRSDVFAASTIERMQREYAQLLAAVVADSSHKISEYELAIDAFAQPVPETLAKGFASDVQPRTAEEWMIAGMWTQVSGGQRAGVHDRLRSDADTNTHLVKLICQAFPHLSNVDVERRVAARPTVAGLAAFVCTRRQG